MTGTAGTVWTSSEERRATRKERGAFFTPAPMARFIVDWALDEGVRSVLEPSVGEAVFLRQVAESVRASSRPPSSISLNGVDIHADSLTRAAHALADTGIAVDLQLCDFFRYAPDHRFDAVLGNPPYIRYQDFTGPVRARAREVALAAGVALTALASSWAAFTVRSAALLTEGGKLGLVLPAELLTVNYAAPVRTFLLRHFDSVRLVLFTERVFPDVQEEVVLLLAAGYRREGAGTDHFDLLQLESLEDLEHLPADLRSSPWVRARAAERWTAALVEGTTPLPEADCQRWSRLGDWGRIALGAVSGANDYFALSRAQARARGLGPKDLEPLSPPGSTHLRSLVLDRSRMMRLEREGKRTVLFHPAGKPSIAAQEYIDEGEKRGIDQRFKCRVRSPWWLVPLQPVADLFLTYMNAHAVALCANTAGVRHLNSVHGVFLGEDLEGVDPVACAVAALNTVTTLSCELRGRAYGGGLLKVEPREAVSLLVPAPAFVRTHEAELVQIAMQVGPLLDQGRWVQARARVDAFLMEHALFDEVDLASWRSSHELLASRRKARGRKVHE